MKHLVRILLISEPYCRTARAGEAPVVQRSSSGSLDVRVVRVARERIRAHEG